MYQKGILRLYSICRESGGWEKTVMWKISKRLAACMFAAAWWGIFYPELCFSEDTCAVVRTEETQEENGSAQEENGEARERKKGRQSCPEEMEAADIWQASGDRIVIRSRFWEWCEENWFYE